MRPTRSSATHWGCGRTPSVGRRPAKTIQKATQAVTLALISIHPRPMRRGGVGVATC